MRTTIDRAIPKQNIRSMGIILPILLLIIMLILSACGKSVTIPEVSTPSRAQAEPEASNESSLLKVVNDSPDVVGTWGGHQYFEDTIGMSFEFGFDEDNNYYFIGYSEDLFAILDRVTFFVEVGTFSINNNKIVLTAVWAADYDGDDTSLYDVSGWEPDILEITDGGILVLSEDDEYDDILLVRIAPSGHWRFGQENSIGSVTNSSEEVDISEEEWHTFEGEGFTIDIPGGWFLDEEWDIDGYRFTGGTLNTILISTYDNTTVKFTDNIVEIYTAPYKDSYGFEFEIIDGGTVDKLAILYWLDDTKNVRLASFWIIAPKKLYSISFTLYENDDPDSLIFGVIDSMTFER